MFCHENFKKSKHGNVGVENEVGATQGQWLALAFGTPWYESFTRGHGWYVLTCKGFYMF